MALLTIAVFMALFIATALPAHGEVAVYTQVYGTGVQISPMAEINLTRNASEYKGATITWTPQNVTLDGNYYNLTGIVRVHVNWDFNIKDYYILNVISITNSGNRSGSFYITLLHYAKQANVYLNNSTVSALSAYIKLGYQSRSSLGTPILNNTRNGPFNLYPVYEPYYIGFNYTRPLDTVNSVGQYLNFTFSFVYED